MDRLGSITLFSCPSKWPLRGVMSSASLVLGTQGTGFWRLPCVQDGKSTGPVFPHLSINRKVIMDFISLIRRFVIKCQMVRRYPKKTPFVLVASLNLEILPFLETVPLLHISANVALPACHPLTALCSLWEGTPYASSPSQGLSALALAPCGLPQQQRPGSLVGVLPFGLGGLFLLAVP